MVLFLCKGQSRPCSNAHPAAQCAHLHVSPFIVLNYPLCPTRKEPSNVYFVHVLFTMAPRPFFTCISTQPWRNTQPNGHCVISLITRGTALHFAQIPWPDDVKGVLFPDRDACVMAAVQSPRWSIPGQKLFSIYGVFFSVPGISNSFCFDLLQKTSLVTCTCLQGSYKTAKWFLSSRREISRITLS